MIPPTKISVIICTFNRAAMLSEAIDSFFSMDLPAESEFDLLIVDNNSADHTLEIVSDRQKKYGASLKYFLEPKMGLSQARNRGIAESLGEIIAYVDDDVYFDSQWLKNVLMAFQQYPDTNAIGGKTVAQFECKRPTWLSDKRLENFRFGSTNHGDQVKTIKYPEYPYGTNMAFRRNALVQTGGFSLNLGRTPNTLLSNEESEFFYRFNEMNFTTTYIPTALIHHRIQKNRITRRWIVSRFYWQGISNAVMKNNIAPQNRIDLLRLSLLYTKNIFYELFGKNVHPICFFRHLLGFRFDRLVIIVFYFGFLKQTIRIFFNSKRNRI